MLTRCKYCRHKAVFTACFGTALVTTLLRKKDYTILKESPTS